MPYHLAIAHRIDNVYYSPSRGIRQAVFFRLIFFFFHLFFLAISPSICYSEIVASACKNRPLKQFFCLISCLLKWLQAHRSRTAGNVKKAVPPRYDSRLPVHGRNHGRRHWLRRVQLRLCRCGKERHGLYSGSGYGRCRSFCAVPTLSITETPWSSTIRKTGRWINIPETSYCRGAVYEGFRHRRYDADPAGI